MTTIEKNVTVKPKKAIKIQPVALVTYACSHCGEQYDSEYEAERCCDQWECPECSLLYGTENEAALCCADYFCGTCGAECCSAIHANRHCRDIEAIQ